jgi:hypothetical protein
LKSINSIAAKRGNTSSKKHMRVLGYVAQMLALDMDRAKENSWTCFVPTNKIDYESMNLAIKRWKKSHPEYAKTEAFEALKNSPVVESPNRPPELHQLKHQTASDMITDEPVKSNTTFATTQMECKNLNTIPNEDIEIKSDSLRNGFVLQGEWNGYPGMHSIVHSDILLECSHDPIPTDQRNRSKAKGSICTGMQCQVTN